MEHFLEILIEILKAFLEPNITDCSPADDPLDPLSPPSNETSNTKPKSRFSWGQKQEPLDSRYSTDKGDIDYLQRCSEGFNAINTNDPNRTDKLAPSVTIGRDRDGNATAVKSEVRLQVAGCEKAFTFFRSCISGELFGFKPNASQDAFQPVDDSDLNSIQEGYESKK